MIPPDFSPRALAAVAAFLPIFSDPAFPFVRPQVRPTLDLTYHPEVERFTALLTELGWWQSRREFDWHEWMLTPQAHALRVDPGKVAHTSPETLARLLCIFGHQERTCAGTRLIFHESGLLAAILRRAGDLAQSS